MMKRIVLNRTEKKPFYLSIQTITIFSTLFLVFGSLLISCSLSMLSKADSLESHTCYKYYKSIEIEQDDTLWNIAERYCGEHYQNRNDYIEEIARLNHIDKDQIHSGQYLLVPYFSEKDL
ncbi:MAG: LysM peptidoglycan-binding domain-containing protein [Lachnospiraceae bacterium]|nr:LysM peptidoglycan-binding domain-containing protein [Lachnospiraceae bacterium]